MRNLAAVIASSSVSEKQVWTSPVPQWSGAVACRRRMYRLSLSFSSRWTQAKMLVCVSSLFVRLKYRCRTKRLAELWLCAVTAEQNNLHASMRLDKQQFLKMWWKLPWVSDHNLWWQLTVAVCHTVTKNDLCMYHRMCWQPESHVSAKIWIVFLLENLDVQQ